MHRGPQAFTSKLANSKARMKADLTMHRSSTFQPMEQMTGKRQEKTASGRICVKREGASDSIVVSRARQASCVEPPQRIKPPESESTPRPVTKASKKAAKKRGA